MRKSRIYPLEGMASGSHPYFDQIFFYPLKDEVLRMWLISSCTEAQISLDDMQFDPLKAYPTEAGFAVDYGTLTDSTGWFGQLRIRNMPWNDLAHSFLILTPKLDWIPSGSMEEMERSLWGISRNDAGCSMLSPDRIEAGKPAEFHAFYRPAITLPAGSQIRFGVPFAFSYPQCDSPQNGGFIHACGSYSSPLPQRIEKGPEGHERVYAVFVLERELPAGELFEAVYYTDQVYLYPQCYNASEMKYWFSCTPVLNVSVALPDREDFVFLQDQHAHSMTVIPGKPEKLHLFLPGRRHAGEKICLRGLFTDRYHNPTHGRPENNFNLFLCHNGKEMPLNLKLQYQDFCRFSVDLNLDEPGVYRVRALNPQGKLIAQSNPFQLLDQSDPRSNVYWGDIHVHSEMSDGIGRYQDLFLFGRDMASLDFAAAADHSCYFTDNEWDTMQQISTSLNENGRFTTLIGYEWAGKQVHRCLYTQGEELDLFRGMYPPTSTLDVVYQHFHGREDIVAGPHGSVAHGLVFEHHDPTVERFAEIYSMWGNQDEMDTEHPPVKPSNRAIPVYELIQKGVKLGFTGGGDCHEAHPGFSSCDENRQGEVPHAFAQLLRYRCGLTAARMPSLDRSHLIDALRNGGTYATSGERLLVDFDVLFESEKDQIQSEYHLNLPGSKLYLYSNGQLIHNEALQTMDGVFNWQTVQQKENRCYHIKIVQPDGHTVWTSPLWADEQ